MHLLRIDLNSNKNNINILDSKKMVTNLLEINIE